MKKLTAFVMPLKMLGSMIFAGFMILYMVSGSLYGFLFEADINYSVPFAFVLQGLLLSALVSLIWGVFFGEAFIKKWRYFPRLMAFVLSLAAMLAVCFMVFTAVPTEMARLWLAANCVVGAAIVAASLAGEIVFKKTGKRYTEILKEFQEGK